MNFENYPISVAERDFVKLTPDSIQQNNISVAPQYRALRSRLIEARDKVFDELDLDNGIKGKEYLMDLYLGLELYEIFTSKEFKLYNRQVSDDDVWRFLAIKVIPDVVHYRWDFNADHFYKMGRRLYLKTLYWYIHLSWAGSKEATFNILKGNETDVITNLVERPGQGYYIDLYREIMRQYGPYSKSSRTIFRPVMKLNMARLQVIDPELVEGGITQYVSDLFSKVLNQ